MNSQVTEQIENASPEQKPLLKALRKIIWDTFPEVDEQFKWSRPVYGLEKDFCYLVANKKHINFGFYNISEIETGTDLLEGTGKNMRHIKIRKEADIKPELFGKMLKEAAGILHRKSL